MVPGSCPPWIGRGAFRSAQNSTGGSRGVSRRSNIYLKPSVFPAGREGVPPGTETKQAMSTIPSPPGLAEAGAEFGRLSLESSNRVQDRGHVATSVQKLEGWWWLSQP